MRSSGEFRITADKFNASIDTLAVLSNIKLSSSAILKDDKVIIDNRINISETSISDLREGAFKDIELSIESGISLEDFDTEFSADLKMPHVGLDYSANGSITIKDSKPVLVMNLISNFSNDLGIEIVSGFIIAGDLHSTMKTEYDSLLILDGSFVMDNFGFKTPYFEIEGVGGDIPFRQTIDITNLSIKKSSRRDNPFYYESRLYRRMTGAPVENARVGKITAFDREITDIKADVFWDEGVFNMPYYQVSIFGGNMAGSGWMSVDSLDAAGISYGISAQGAEINSEFIAQLKTPGKESSLISFSMNFLGRGIDPASDDFDVQGQLHITKLSPKVAENILFTLDPQQKDKGIQSMLYFLKRGWGVRSFSFELAHGFVYSTIHTQQPPFTKPIPFTISKLLPLEKEIKLSRLPLKFFL